MRSDDWLLRQLTSFAVGVAEALARDTEEVEEADLRFEHVFGAGPELLANMSDRALLGMVTGPEGLDPGRALTLAVGLAQHVRSLEKDERDPVRRKAVAVLDEALEAAPGLRSPGFEALREALVGAVTEH